MRDPHGGQHLMELGVDGVVHQPVEAVPQEGPEADHQLKGGARHVENIGLMR